MSIDISIAILSPAQGLRYHASCPHGRSSRNFSREEVETTTGVEKVLAVATAHRARYTRCTCHADDEYPERAGPRPSSRDLHWEYRIVHLVGHNVHADGYYLCLVTLTQDGHIYGWDDPQPISAATRPGLAGMLSYAQSVFNHPTLVPDLGCQGGLREEQA